MILRKGIAYEKIYRKDNSIDYFVCYDNYDNATDNLGE